MCLVGSLGLPKVPLAGCKVLSLDARRLSSVLDSETVIRRATVRDAQAGVRVDRLGIRFHRLGIRFHRLGIKVSQTKDEVSQPTNQVSQPRQIRSARW